MVLTLKQSGPPRSDETMPFSVEFNDGATVQDLFDEVLVNRSNEWGYIYVNIGLDRPSKYEYRWGKLLEKPPKDTLRRKITKMSADGGWSRMDYYVCAINMEEGSK